MSHGVSAEPTTPLGIFAANWLSWEPWMEYILDWGVSRALVLCTLFLATLVVVASQIPEFMLFLFSWLLGLAPLWLPYSLAKNAWFNWVHYRKHLYISKRESVLLEVRIPREITKSPRAMELVFNNFYLTAGETTVIDRAWKGGTRPWWSFELASFGGEIHFYVWTWKNTRRFAEANIYAQYPGVEIFEVEDYASKFVYDPKIHMCWGSEYLYDPRGDEYPIKTYVDFELDKDPKEELKIDPLATVFEMLASLKPHEQALVASEKPAGGVSYPPRHAAGAGRRVL